MSDGGVVDTREPAASAGEKPKFSIKHPISTVREKILQNKADKEAKNPVAAKFDEDVFVTGARTGEDHNNKRWSRPRKEESRSGSIDIREKTIEGYSLFMKQHLENLLKHQDVLVGPGHEDERTLLTQFSVIGPDGKSRIDKEKVKKFVKTDAGLKQSEMIMTLRTDYEVMAAGLELIAAWGQNEQSADGRRTVNLDDLKREYDHFNRFGRFARTHGGRSPDRYATAFGAASPAGIAGLMRVVQLGAYGVSSVGTGGAFLRRFISSNGDIDFKACVDNLEAIKGHPDPKEKEYIYLVTGVDVDDFNVTGNTVDWARTVADGRRTRDMGSIREDIKERLETQRKFYKTIGLIRPDTRTVPFQRHGFNSGDIPQTNTTWHEDINTEFRRRLAAEIAAAAAAGAPAPTEQDRARFYLDAERNTINRYLKEYLTGAGAAFDPEEGRWIDDAESAESIQSGIDRVAVDTGERTKRLTDHKNALVGEDGNGGDKARLQEEANALKSAEGGSGAGEKSRQEIQSEIDEKIKSTINKCAQALNITTVVDLTTLEARINEQFDLSFTDSLTKQKQLLENRISKEARSYTAQQRTVASSTTDPSGKLHEDTINEIARGPLADILKPDLDKLQEIVNKLNTLSEALKGLPTTEKDIALLQDQLKTHEGKALPYVEQLRDGYDAMIALGFTEVQLATFSDSTIHYLMNRRYNLDVSANVDPPRGWAEENNFDLISRRNLISHARVEARARHALEDGRNAVAILINWGIPSDEIISRPMSEIHQLMHDRWNNGGTPPGSAPGSEGGWLPTQDETMAPRVESAKALPRGIDGARKEAYRTVIADIDREAQDAEEAAKTLNNDDLVARGKLAKGLMEDMGNLFARTEFKFSNEDQRQGFFDVTVVPPDALGYTPNELGVNGAGLPAESEAYYRWMDHIFGYQKGDRNKNFGVARGLVSPDGLAEQLNEVFGLGIPPAAADFASVIQILGTQFDDPNIALGPREVRLAMQTIVHHIRRQAITDLNA